MALETSGFQLSQFERAPQIPGNIGVVDTKGIYGSVVDALKSYEALRTTQAVQAATDAELALATQKAQTEMGLLGPEAEARQAKAQLFTAEAPYQKAQLGLRSQAEQQKYLADIARNKLLAQPGIAEQAVLGKILTPAEREIRNLSARLQDENISDPERRAIEVRLKQAVDANTAARNELAAAKLQKVTLADGTTIMVPSYALASPATGAQALVPSTGVSPVAMPTGGFAPSTGVLAAPTMGAGGVVGGPVTKMDVERQKLLAKGAQQYGVNTPLSMIPGDEAKKAFIEANADIRKENEKSIRAQQSNLDLYNQELQKDLNVEKTIDELLNDARANGIFISGGGVVGRGLRALMPGQEAAFRSKLGLVAQHIQLGNMMRLKNASSAGATGFGNLTENEGALLRADYGNFENPNLPNDAMIATLERAKEGLQRRRQEAIETIRSKLGRERTLESQVTENLYGPEAGSRLRIPMHPLEAVAAQAATEEETPTETGPSAADIGAALFPKAPSMAPARLTFGAPAASPLVPEAGPHTAGPLEEVPTTTGKYEDLTVKATPTVSSYPGRVVTPTTPVAPAPATSSQYQYPAASLMGFLERAPSSRRTPSPDEMLTLSQAAKAVGGFDRLLGALGTGITTGDYSLPQKGALAQAGEAIGGIIGGSVADERERMRREDEILRTRPNSWEAYDIRRSRGLPGPAKRVAAPAPVPAPAPEVVEETVIEEPAAPAPAVAREPVELPQIKLSPEAEKTARNLLSEYQAGQRAKEGEQPVLEITASDGKRIPIDNPSVAKMVLGILTGQQAPNLAPRLEPDREGTRRLTEDRMRREELARQFRTMPRR